MDCCTCRAHIHTYTQESLAEDRRKEAEAKEAAETAQREAAEQARHPTPPYKVYEP